MDGTAIDIRDEQTPKERDAAPQETQTPTVIDVESYPVAQNRTSRAVVLVDRGLALLSSLMRLALWWIENREGQTQQITSRQQTSASPASTPAARRPVGARGSERRQRRRRRGRNS